MAEADLARRGVGGFIDPQASPWRERIEAAGFGDVLAELPVDARFQVVRDGEGMTFFRQSRLSRGFMDKLAEALLEGPSNDAA